MHCVFRPPADFFASYHTWGSLVKFVDKSSQRLYIYVLRKSVYFKFFRRKPWRLPTIPKSSSPSGRPAGRSKRPLRLRTISPSPSSTVWWSSPILPAPACTWAISRPTPAWRSSPASAAWRATMCSSPWASTPSAFPRKTTPSRPTPIPTSSPPGTWTTSRIR